MPDLVVGLAVGALAAGIPLLALLALLRRAARRLSHVRESLGAERDALRERLITARSELEAARRQASDHLQLLQSIRGQLDDQLKAWCADALKQSSSQLLALAEQRQRREQAESQRSLERTSHSLRELIVPVADALQRFDGRLQNLEGERAAAQAQLREQLGTLAEAHQRLLAGTQTLATALRTPRVRGQWGEQTLRRVFEVAGAVKHVDWVEQPTMNSPDGVRRPDALVHLPEGRDAVVDSKVPLAAYLSAMSAETETERREHLLEHARQLRTHLRQLGGKEYWRHLPSSSVEAVFAFVPDAALTAALEADPELLREVDERRVFIATPMTLLTLLRVVAFSWRQVKLDRQAQEICHLGSDLHARLEKLSEHLGRVGRRLEATVSAYNEAIGSYEGRVLVPARRLADLGAVDDTAQLGAPAEVVKVPRALRLQQADGQAA